MISMECNLIRKTYVKDKYGIVKEENTSFTIPIIENEDIYSNEFYQANQSGFKITLRLRISSFNYNEEKELEYMNKIYTVIRVSRPNLNEVVLLCEEKVKNA